MLIRLADLAGINRRLGRSSTDDYLRRSAAAIAQCAALTDQGLAARLNGADFAVMLPGESSGLAAAEALLKVLVDAATVENEPAAWIGVGVFAQATPLGAVLARVDGALAGAEASGRSAVYEAPVEAERQLAIGRSSGPG